MTTKLIGGEEIHGVCVVQTENFEWSFCDGAVLKDGKEFLVKGEDGVRMDGGGTEDLRFGVDVCEHSFSSGVGFFREGCEHVFCSISR